MNSKIYQALFKAFLLSGSILTGWAAHAQSSGAGNMSTDTASHKEMHRHWGNRSGNDSLAKRDGFRRGGKYVGSDGRGMGFHRGGEGRWQAFGEGSRRPGRGGVGGQGWAHRGFGHGNGIRYTPEQRKQVMAINTEIRKRSADLFKKDNITLKEYKAGLIALQKEKKSRLEALLTQQQKDQLAARKKKASENMQVMAAARMERLKLRLNLSDDQVAKLRSGQESLRSQMRSIHENQELLPQQKREQLKDLVAKRQDTFKSVLTPDQLSKFQERSHWQAK
jgi:hypothetical protein